ncbi:hypothetical protein [Thermomonospora umbrina]|uniref:Uncharacterized protein n=1 Tax=Thermomonospora umbrina TaxID=111806 RepID=A0A3D9SXI0_9ACTN|nr:hypothetical protein [Thermomonospora umbrina]REF00559.1 hypothetical protein DFJ69_6109 [Thermomonospora umbrina]
MPATSDDPSVTTSRLVVVGCSGRKKLRPAPAGQMYEGPFHRLCREAADAMAGPDGQVLILSAKYDWCIRTPGFGPTT